MGLCFIVAASHTGAGQIPGSNPEQPDVAGSLMDPFTLRYPNIPARLRSLRVFRKGGI
jgi:hypothetical protein